MRYRVHGHLYSPVAFLNHYGSPLERYEYGAYGEPTIYTDKGNDGIWLTADDVIGTSSAQDNFYLFTGRRVDILDNGSLKIQYNRNRYYDYYTGRWLSHDPLGINPAGGLLNRFSIQRQYKDAMSLYEYATSNPLINTDPLGLFAWPPWLAKPCGIFTFDMTFTIDSIKQKALVWFGCTLITKEAIKKATEKKLKGKEIHTTLEWKCTPPCTCHYLKDKCFLLDIYHAETSTVDATGKPAPPAKKECEITVNLIIHLKPCYAVGKCCP